METRKKGYAYSRSELEVGTAAFGTPIFNHHGEIEASLSVAGIETQVTAEDYIRFVEPMWEVSEKISVALGFSKPYPYLKNKGVYVN